LTHATLIYNPVAGRNPVRRQAEIRAAMEALRQTQFEVEVQPTTGPGSARNLARSAAETGADAVVVCGGDGTINEVVNGLALSQCPLAILPGGTANIAARDLGLSLRPVTAAGDLAVARSRRIALGRVTWGKAPVSRTAGSMPAPPESAGSPSTLHGTAASSGQDSVAPPRARYVLSVAGVGFGV